MDKELAAIGPEDFVLGFQLAGVKKVVATTPETYAQRIATLLADRTVGIVITRTEDVAALAAQLRHAVSTQMDPVVIQLGGGAGEGLRDKIRSAIGIDLLRE